MHEPRQQQFTRQLGIIDMMYSDEKDGGIEIPDVTRYS